MARTMPTARRPPTVSALFGECAAELFQAVLPLYVFQCRGISLSPDRQHLPYVVLAPTIVVGAITLGAMNQILNAFGQVRSSFQYLVNSWTTIVELLSIYKRLRAFEAAIEGAPLDAIEQVAPSTVECLATGSARGQNSLPILRSTESRPPPWTAKNSVMPTHRIDFSDPAQP